MTARMPRRLAALATAAGLLLLGATPAVASGSSPSPTPGAGKQITVPANNVTFAVATSDGTTNDRRQIFRYNAQPGETITDHVIVYNLGTVKGNFVAYTMDAVTSDTGAFTLSTLTEKQQGFGAWARTKKTFFSLAGGQTLVIPFTVTVPKNAVPGDTVGGVVVSDVPQRPEIGSIQQQLAVATRIGLRTVVRVGGELRASLEVTDLTTSFEAVPSTPGYGRLTASWTVTNTGNVRLAARRLVQVQALLGGTLVSNEPARLDQILPGASVRESATFEGVFAGIRLSTSVEATPVVLEGDVVAADPARATDTIWAISWIAVGIISLIVALLTLLVMRLRNRRGAAGGGAHGGTGQPDRATGRVGAGVSS